MKIMIVEDSLPMRDMIKTVMSKFPHEFIECSDGEEAVKAYKQFRPDFTLMDVEMNPMDGLTATKKIKSIDPGARVIMVTNYGDKRTRDAARLAGAEGFVLKENLLEVQKLITEST